MSKEEFPIPRAEKLHPLVKRTFGRIQRGERTIKRRAKVQLRASSFPICPRAYHIYRRLKPGDRPLVQERFMSEGATSQGTALHETLQKWFGIRAEAHAYGNWTCKPCKKRKKHRTGIQTCNKCGQDMKYQEYSITPNKDIPFSGHIDMIFKIPEMTFITDFKGSNVDKIKKLRMDGKPYENNYLQVNAYASAINARSHTDDFGGVKIDKIIILYVDRGAPHRLWHPIQVPISPKLYQKCLGLIRRGKESIKDLRLPEGLCISPNDQHAYWCEWKGLCFDPLLETRLEDSEQPV